MTGDGNGQLLGRYACGSKNRPELLSLCAIARVVSETVINNKVHST